VESDNKIVPVTTGALGTIRKGLYQSLQLLPGPSAIEPQEGLTNDHFTHHSKSAWVIRFDLLLRSGIARRPPPNN
jgi:hypothetical protein